MSKRQEKIQARMEERNAFLTERRKVQLAMIEQAYAIGLKMYEDNKDKLSADDVAQIEAMKADQLATIEKLKRELDDLNPSPQA